jgi:transposase
MDVVHLALVSYLVHAVPATEGSMKVTPGRTATEREAYWTKIITEARNNAQGVAAYLREHDIPQNNYYHYFGRLRSDHPEWKDLSTDGRHLAMKERARRKAKAPKTEVPEKAQRRQFSPTEKVRILKEIDECEPGKVAAVLRREGIYSSQVQSWRLAMANASTEAVKRGPKPNPAAEEIGRLKAQLAKAEKKLAKANAVIEFQKKMGEILRTSMEIDDE